MGEICFLSPTLSGILSHVQPSQGPPGWPCPRQGLGRAVWERYCPPPHQVASLGARVSPTLQACLALLCGSPASGWSAGIPRPARAEKKGNVLTTVACPSGMAGHRLMGTGPGQALPHGNPGRTGTGSNESRRTQQPHCHMSTPKQGPGSAPRRKVRTGGR